MQWTFNNPHNIKQFANHIAIVLETQGESTLSKELHSWINSCHTTSSEFLGEICNIMHSILIIDIVLHDDERKGIETLVEDINKAFRKVNGR